MQPERTPIDTLLSAGAVVLALVAVVALTIGATQYAGFRIEAARHAKVLDLPSRFLPAVRQAEATELAGYRWVDRKGGIVAIPLDRAIEVTLAERGRP